MNASGDRPRRLESLSPAPGCAGAKERRDPLRRRDRRAVALVDSARIDFAAALAYGRKRGGPALRRMSFHERGVMLKALAQSLMERKEEFYALSTATAPRVQTAGSTSKAASGHSSPMRRRAGGSYEQPRPP